MSNIQNSKAALIISLTAGIFILLGGFIGGGFFCMCGLTGVCTCGGNCTCGMMGRTGATMAQPYNGVLVGMWVLGLVSGIIVLISAILIKIRPEQTATWGTLIFVFAIVSLFGSSRGGFLIGAMLGIVGGALALSSKPKG